MTKPVTHWNVTIDTICPQCGRQVDLLPTDGFKDWYNLLISYHYGEANRLAVTCPHCGSGFHVAMDLD